MLVTTSKAEGQSVKLGGKTLTFYFPTVQSPPEARIQGDVVVIGKQRITLKDGNLTIGVSME